MEMADSYGDGWDSAGFALENSEGEVEATGTLASGDWGTVEVCGLPVGSCYTMAVSAGSYPSEISWEITQSGVGVVAAGAAPATCGHRLPQPSAG